MKFTIELNQNEISDLILNNTLLTLLNSIASTNPKTYTLDELIDIAEKIIANGKKDELISTLNSFGFASLTELPQEQYVKFVAQLKVNGVVL